MFLFIPEMALCIVTSCSERELEMAGRVCGS